VIRVVYYYLVAVVQLGKVPQGKFYAEWHCVRSFIFGEYAVRFKAAPISSGIAVNAFFRISSVIGFMVSGIA
jgi:hypothetical protein